MLIEMCPFGMDLDLSVNRFTLCHLINRLLIQVTEYSENKIKYVHSYVSPFVLFNLSHVTDQRIIIHTSIRSVYITFIF